MGTVIARQRLFLTADKSKLVAEGDAEGAFLYVAPGDEIPEDAHDLFELVDGALPDFKTADPGEIEQKVPSVAPPPGPKEKRVQQAAAASAAAAKRAQAKSDKGASTTKEAKPGKDKEAKPGADKGDGAGDAGEGAGDGAGEKQGG